MSQPTAYHQLRQKLSLESSRQYRARGILVKRCEQCLLAEQHCICADKPGQASHIDFVLIYHRDEVFKPTNTGRLIADCFPQNTYAFVWDRIDPDPQLIDLLNDKSRQCVMIFPSDEQRHPQFDHAQRDDQKRLTLILLDATWRQARRMRNLSRWLDGIPCIDINPSNASTYATRKASAENYLSTAEATAMALAQLDEIKLQKTVENYFHRFNQNYSAMRSNLTGKASSKC